MVDIGRAAAGQTVTSSSADGPTSVAGRGEVAGDRPAAGVPTGLTPAEVVARVRAAYRTGRTRPLEWRAEQLRGIERLVVDHEEELLEAMATDFGKPRLEAWLADLAPVAAEAAHSRRHLRQWAQPRRGWPGRANLPGSAWSVPEPLGTVLVISPWNYPVQLALNPLAAAVAAGNAVVLKPSELVPSTSAALARLVPRYLDPDAVAVVEGAVDVATELLAQPFDHIFFTGSTSVGKVVMRAAAEHLASVTLELGGKSPVIVAADADLEVAARRIAWGKLLNAGQTCIAPDYVLVERAVADRFVDRLVAALGSLQGPDPAATRTRIVNERHAERLRSLLDGAGGTVVCGGRVDVAERVVEPTVVLDPDLETPLMQDEIFGPVLPVVRVGSIDEAVSFVADRPKPLALYLFTGSKAVEERVLGATTSGGACINHVMYHFLAPDLPFGGVGPSGTGAYHGRAGFDELSHHKTVVRRRTSPDPSFAYPPYDSWKERIIRRVM
jgi:aldehyde dehydrogenase (NAD+)